MSKADQSKKIVIQGKTEAGEHFRPSDWAERMSGNLASFRNRRIHYSPLLQPKVNQDGYKCVVLDPALKKSNPALYESILQFAQNNSLTVFDEDS